MERCLREFKIQSCLPGVVQAWGCQRAGCERWDLRGPVSLCSAVLCFSCPVACRVIKMLMMFILFLLAAPQIWLLIYLNNSGMQYQSLPWFFLGVLSVEIEIPQCQIAHRHFKICVKWVVIRELSTIWSWTLHGTATHGHVTSLLNTGAVVTSIWGFLCCTHLLLRTVNLCVSFVL